MTTSEKFNDLKELDINAVSDLEREKLNIEFEKLADEDPDGFEKAVIASAKKTLEDAKTLKVREQIEKISAIISMTYIANTYFNKSKSWLSQRINELPVNGKPVKFLPNEIDTLNYAFADISKQIGAFRIYC